MKSPFFKSLLVACALVCAWNCTDDNVTTPPAPGGTQFAAVPTTSWIFEGDIPYVIIPTDAGLLVTDNNGTPLGTFVITTGTISNGEGVAIATGIDLSSLTRITPEQTFIAPNGKITDTNGNVLFDPNAEDPNQGGQGGEDPNQGGQDPNQGGENPNQGGQDPVITSSETAPVIPTSSATTNPEQPKSSSSSQQQQQPASSATQSGQCGEKQCFDAPSSKCVGYYENLRGPKDEQYAYDKTCTVNCYWDPNGKDCKNMGAVTPTSSSQQQQQPKSSSSQQQPKSSSSSQQQPKSSSSSAKSSSSSQGGNNGTYQIKYINGGKSGSGYASRYWDCCKPHCAWPEHGGTASTCDATGNKISDKSASSMCDGGNAGICRSQFPVVINDTLAFAFAATPGGESNCGKCFDLAFTGQGKYATDNHSKLKGKHLIVMSNNVGYDVAGGQFDVMIPGGGYGIFNGCSQKMGWGSQGAQYGGLLTECEESSGYKASTYKSCLTNKCNSSFANDPEAKEGCLFMANWMEAAGNPLHNYREVECPQELKNRF